MAPSFSPLDEELGLVRGQLPPTLQAGVAWVGATVPFAAASQALAALAQVQLSPATVRRVTQRAGRALEAAEAAALAQLEQTLPPAPPGPPVLQISVDGAMVPVVGGEYREARTMVGAEIRRSRHPTQPGKTAHLSYFSRLTDAESFARQATLEVHRRGTERAEIVAAVADGALWCQDFFDLHCPAAVRILDFPHAVHYLHQAAQAVFGEATPAARAWVDQQTATLRQGEAAAVLEAVAALPVAAAPDPPSAGTTQDQVYAYLDARRPQLAYATFLAQGLPIGSGAVESANKLVVEARLKGAGMHWLPANVNAMLSLRCAIASDRWTEAWAQLVRQWQGQPRPRHRQLPPPEPSAVREFPSPPAIAPRAAPPPRAKTIVNGKPTPDHPWRRPFFPNSRTAYAQITKK